MTEMIMSTRMDLVGGGGGGEDRVRIMMYRYLREEDYDGILLMLSPRGNIKVGVKFINGKVGGGGGEGGGRTSVSLPNIGYS